MPRRPLSTRERFEILKRDGFTCQYCGAKPPDVKLHVDHIDPVAGGGKNEHGNYITSCGPCNLGKSDHPLMAVTPCEFCGTESHPMIFSELPTSTDVFSESPERIGVVCTDCVTSAIWSMWHIANGATEIYCEQCDAMFPMPQRIKDFRVEHPDYKFNVEAGKVWELCDPCFEEWRAGMLAKHGDRAAT